MSQKITVLPGVARGLAEEFACRTYDDIHVPTLEKLIVEFGAVTSKQVEDVAKIPRNDSALLRRPYLVR